MKDLHIKVKDSEYDFLIKLLSSFDFVELDNQVFLSKEQKGELERRYQEIKSGTAQLIDYDEFIKILE